MVKKVNDIKTSDTSNLVEKADYNTKKSEIEKKILDLNREKYITTQKCNKLLSENFAARLKQAHLTSKNDIDDFLRKGLFDEKLIKINRKVTLNKTKHVEVKNKLDDI